MTEKKKYNMRLSEWLGLNAGLAFFGLGALKLLLSALFHGQWTGLGVEAVVTLSTAALCGWALRFLHTRVRLV